MQRDLQKIMTTPNAPAVAAETRRSAWVSRPWRPISQPARNSSSALQTRAEITVVRREHHEVQQVRTVDRQGRGRHDLPAGGQLRPDLVRGQPPALMDRWATRRAYRSAPQ